MLFWGPEAHPTPVPPQDEPCLEKVSLEWWWVHWVVVAVVGAYGMREGGGRFSQGDVMNQTRRVQR